MLRSASKPSDGRGRQQNNKYRRRGHSNQSSRHPNVAPNQHPELAYTLGQESSRYLQHSRRAVKNRPEQAHLSERQVHILFDDGQ